MGQVAPVRQRHAEHRVAWLAGREKYGLVGLRARMGLDVREFRAKELGHAINRKLLSHVDELAAAVVAFAWIAFRIFVGELRPLRRHHRGAGVVFRRNQLDVGFLATVLAADGLPELWVGVCENLIAALHGIV